MANDLRVIFFGTPNFVVPVLESLGEHFDLVGVVTTPDTVEGRKKILTPSPVKKAYLASHPGGTVIIPEQFNNLPAGRQGSTIQQLKALSPDLFVVAAYGKIIPQAVLDIPKYGSINIHPSLLPKYRGPSPIQTALLNGDRETGVSIILMDAEVDHGPILSQWTHEVSPDDTFASLHQILFQQAAEQLPQIITDFVSHKLSAQEQEHTKATYCQKITREDGIIKLENPPKPEQLDRMIRAFYPWPGVSVKLPIRPNEEKTVKLLPGKRIQVEGKNEMSSKDFLNGYPQMREVLTKLVLI